MTENVTTTESKPLVKSKTFFGILLTGVSAILPDLIQMPGTLGKVGLVAGVLLSLWGRADAKGPISGIFTSK